MSHLELLQQVQMYEFLHRYQDLFPNVHDVDIGDTQPIKQHPYQMSPAKRTLTEKEVAYLTKHNIIQPSHSNLIGYAVGRR